MKKTFWDVEKHREVERKPFMDDLFNEFNLPPEISSTLERYYILHWSGSFFSSLYYKSSGRINRELIQYQIIFHGSVSEILSAQNVALSFRKPKDLPLGIVLVRAL